MPQTREGVRRPEGIVPMSLLLVRHGETALNVARVLQPADTPLSDTGLRQAALLARRIAEMRPAAIVSSPLPRAWQTAQAIALATGLPVEGMDTLQERHFGSLRGQPYDVLGFDPLHMAEAPPGGGESLATFHARAAAALAALAQRQRPLPGPLVVVTHGLVLRAWLDHHLQVPPTLALAGPLGNTAITVCAAVPPHTAELVNCTAHLAGDSRHAAGSLVGG